MNASLAPSDHLVPDGFDPVPPPLTPPVPSPRPTPAEAARTLLAQTRTGSLAFGHVTLADAGVSMFSGFYLPGDPWGTFAVALTTGP